jgi:hypothetical protein
MSAIETVLWPGIKAIVGDDAVLAGITVNKGGYHSTRNWLRANKTNDYSIQLPIDQLGPGDEGAAIDVTFKTAQRGNYTNIAKYMDRLMKAGRDKDPRAYPLREAFGQDDNDLIVEGWSYYRDRAMSSDPSHLWHIHQSIWRKYINDAAAMRSILSIWNGKEEEEDMPTVKEIWDAPLPAPRRPDIDNPTWQADSYVRFIAEKELSIEAKMKALDAKLDAILAAVKPPTP